MYDFSIEDSLIGPVYRKFFGISRDTRKDNEQFCLKLLIMYIENNVWMMINIYT